MKPERDHLTTIWVPMATSVRSDLKRIHKKLLALGKTNVADEKFFAAALLEDAVKQLVNQFDPPLIVTPEVKLQ